MLIIHTGQGKGKTTAALGLVLRCLGHSLRPVFGQCMKRDGQAGEQAMLHGLLGPDFLAGGLGFCRSSPGEPDFAKHRASAHAVLAWALQRLAERPAPDLLVLDEALYALAAGLFDRAEVERLLDAAATCGAHLVLTGRGLPDWLADRADLITEMRLIKHPYDQGVAAQKGIEF